MIRLESDLTRRMNSSPKTRPTPREWQEIKNELVGTPPTRSDDTVLATDLAQQRLLIWRVVASKPVIYDARYGLRDAVSSAWLGIHYGLRSLNFGGGVRMG